jgi:BTB/POZ domain
VRPRSLTSAILTLCVGREQRLFAAHEDVLSNSPYFAHLIRQQFFESNKRIDLPDDEPEVFSSVLEFLYKGDYFPRLEYDKRRQSWSLESDGEKQGTVESTVYMNGIGYIVLKDTVIYCFAQKYGLPELQRLALRKQGLQSGIQCSTILTSARYAYANTPDTDSKLRAHYLALIIRSRHTFKRSGTMQVEMEQGGKLFFDLFVAMCNHMVRTPSSHSPY